MAKYFLMSLFFLCWYLGSAAQQLPIGNNVVKDSLKNKLPKAIIPLHKNYYQSTLGVMCKFENKLEAATKLPIRFRLGSLAQADYLDKKPNAGIMQ